MALVTMTKLILCGGWWMAALWVASIGLVSADELSRMDPEQKRAVSAALSEFSPRLAVWGFYCGVPLSGVMATLRRIARAAPGTRSQLWTGSLVLPLAAVGALFGVYVALGLAPSIAPPEIPLHPNAIMRVFAASTPCLVGAALTSPLLPR